MGRISSFLKREYGGHFGGDLSGGLTTAVVALPLALAFAVASGVDAKYGLYTAIIAGTVAAIFGGSAVQVSGPTGGMAAVLIFVTSQFGYQKVVIIALMAGAFQIFAGLLKLGRYVKMLPFPLVAGFTMGIGIVIFGGQLDHAIGLQIHHQQTQFFDRMTESIYFALYGINRACVGITVGTIISILVLQKLWPRLPAGLITIVLASIAARLLNLEVPHISNIPRSLPSPHMPSFSWEMFRGLLRPAATVAALGAIESLLAAVVADNVLADGSRHNSNRELVGQGLANIFTSFFGGIPCTGAIARTAVNIKSGGRTRLAALIHSGALLIAMLFLAPWATYIPTSALAGILMLTAIRMVEWREVQWLMTAPRSDITIMVITVLVTVFTDLVMAVEFGLAVAAVLFIRKMADAAPQSIVMDSEAGSLNERIRIFRLPGALFWGGSHAVLEAIEACENIQVVILKMQFVTHIDASGVSTLREANNRLQSRGIRLFLVGVPHQTMKIMNRMGITEEIKRENIFRSLEEAKAACV